LSQHIFGLLVNQAVTDPIGNGVDQAGFFFQEGSVIPLGHLFGVKNIDSPYWPATGDNLRRLNPFRFSKFIRSKNNTVDFDASYADIGILPTGGDSVDNPAAHHFQSSLGITEGFLDLVDAV